jgi:hypothetical protein
METELAVFEPIRLPDPRRPATLPSLPAWAERLSGAVRLELQMTPDGKTFEKNDILVLPANLMASPDQRLAMRAHRDHLRSYLLDTPANSVTAETQVATAVSKLMTVLAGERKSDLVEEARSDVYLEVLDDVPWWAVEAAARAWFRHECGTDERGRPHDYKWAPDPGTLRKMALTLSHPIGARIRTMKRVLEAREYVDCTKQLADGRGALDGLNKTIKAGDLNAVQTLTFDQAVKLGCSNRTEETDLPAQEAGPTGVATPPVDQSTTIKP